MTLRPAAREDLAAITQLQRQCESKWFGAPESDENEIGESFHRVDPLGEHSRVLVDEGRMLAAAWWWSTSTTLLVDPSIDPAPVYAELLPWLAGQGVHAVEALSSDEQLIGALTARGWRHVNSAFELRRPVDADLDLAAPVWPPDIEVREFRVSDARAIHELIYVDAAWAEVRGHPQRSFDEWSTIFVTADTLPEQQVLAWRGDRLVGIAMGRTFSDGMGWIAQLAVAKDARGQGLGRALLLEGLRRRRDAGASALGLSVQAENRGALSLYLDVGLRIDREWQEFEPPS